MTQCIRHHPPANFDSCSMAWPNMSCDGCFSPKRECVGLELTPRGYVHMISREKLERHSCKCYGQIHSYVAGVFTICGCPATRRSTYLVSARSCGDRRMYSAATFSSRCAIDDVPGIGTVMGERASNHAMAI